MVKVFFSFKTYLITVLTFVKLVGGDSIRRELYSAVTVAKYQHYNSG